MTEPEPPTDPRHDTVHDRSGKLRDWFRVKLTHAERKRRRSLALDLEAAGFGDRKTCDIRARRCIYFQRMVAGEMDAVATIGIADYERALAFLEETARLASKRPEERKGETGDPFRA